MAILHLGRFDSEPLWRSPDVARLPAAADPQTAAVVERMDELLFCVGERGGHRLVTRHPMHPAHVDYLSDLGFRFSNHQPSAVGDDDGASTCALLAADDDDASGAAIFDGLRGCMPYSILPSTHAMVRRRGLDQPLPAIDAVRRANSKVFAHRIAQETLDECDGHVIDSAAELTRLGDALLADGPVLLKDDMGVSGKGNLRIDSPRLLARIGEHIARQEAQGKETRLVLEPLLDRVLDFSCQLDIGADGRVSVLSVQQMTNQGFAFSAIATATEDLLERLERDGYFTRARQVGARLFDEGYFGPACLDSMLLRDGRVRTLVEINARQSMGYINHRLDQHLMPTGVRGELSLFALGVPRGFDYGQLLDTLADAGLLFTPDRPEGLLPLSARTLTANTEDPDGPAQGKGRLYASVAAGDGERRRAIKAQAMEVVARLGMRVFGGV